MGSGSSKTHESFSVTPSLDPPTDTESAFNETLDDIEPLLADELLHPVPDPTDDTTNQTPDPEPDVDVAGDGALEGAGPDGAGASDPQADPPAPAPSSTPTDDVLTPVPTELPLGDPCGVPVLVGGADLVDSTATLLAYDSTDGPREMLVAVVDQAAEAKLVEALALSDKLVPVQVEQEVHGRLPLDEMHQLHDQVEKVAKSVNHHLKTGDEIPQHTHDNHAKLLASLDAAVKDVNTEADGAMLDHYSAAAMALGERLDPGYSVPYTDGGKVPHLGPYETTTTTTVTKYVPEPPDPSSTALATQTRAASRPKPTLGPDGTATWNGTSRTTASGTEYAVDLGDGYQAVYRPHQAAAGKAPEQSLRGSLEITAPAGGGHGPELVDRLGQLNLVNKPMSAAEGEWAYLQRNVWAQGLTSHTAVSKALAGGDGLEDAMEQVLFAERATQAIGMTDNQLHHFARQLRLDAEAKVLPDKVRLLRDGVATATGHANGAALASSKGYDPTPRRSAGWLTWSRFDVDADRAKVRAAFGNRGLAHHVTSGNLTEVIRTGVLASTERRQLMGIAAGKGASEAQDKNTGGAGSVFLRVASKPSGGPQLFWDDPTTLLSRADWYAYNHDAYGKVDGSGQTRDPFQVAQHHSGTNEVMIRTGLDLLGADAPSRIKCTSATQRQEVLNLLTAKGITHLAGKPINKVVT